MNIVFVMSGIVLMTFYRAYRSSTLQIASYKPDNYLFRYSDYNTTKSGLKIEMLYRKVGTFVWNKAFNDQQKPVVLLDIKPNTAVDVCCCECMRSCSVLFVTPILSFTLCIVCVR